MTLRHKVERVALTCLSVLSLLFLPGCWDYQAINTKATLVGMGFDPVPDKPDEIRITIQYPNLSEDGGSSQGQMSSPSGAIGQFINQTAEGYSIAETLKFLQTRIDRNIDTNQMRAIVFSDKLPNKTMNDIVGELLRRPQFNPLAYVVTTTGSAKDIMETQSPSGAPMDILDRMFSEQFQQHGYAVRRQLWEYWRDVNKIGTTPIIPVAESVPPTAGPSQASQDNIRVAGFEVYGPGDKRTQVSEKDALYTNLIMGGIKNMALDVPLRGGMVSIGNLATKSRLSCRTQGGHLQIGAKIFIRAHVSRIVGNNVSPPTRVSLNQMEADFAAYLKPRLEQEMEKYQAQGTDIFGFSQYYLQRHPDQEQLVKKKWAEMFQGATVKIEITVKITTGGMLI